MVNGETLANNNIKFSYKTLFPRKWSFFRGTYFSHTL